MTEPAQALRQIIEEWLPLLQNITEEQARRKPQPAAWSAGEILGHLIDSAGNHRARWIQVAGQDGLTLPTWDQEQWQNTQNWQGRRWPDILTFWHVYNLHLIHLAQQFGSQTLAHTATVGTLNAGQPMTLQQLLERYDAHLQHHLQQIRERVGV